MFERVKALRKENNLSQNEIAKALNISRSAYGNYERGARNFSLEVLWRLADHYDISLDYLLNRTDCK
ncbi:MAG: helix-turn-helix transcriptional regulator [Oscillospiraceae bacterium]|nr:helix-turn-helix transcriptional regulator [Oscillospiraceae bacterium]